jgi:hypothetical protein
VQKYGWQYHWPQHEEDHLAMAAMASLWPYLQTPKRTEK